MVVLPDLYPHQIAMRDDLRAAMAKYRRVILCAPPGMGKTRLAKVILGSFANRQKKDRESGNAMFAVHRRGLVDNASGSFSEFPELPHGVIMAGRETSGGCDIQVASIDTKLSWYCENGQYATDLTYDLICLDECIAGDSMIETNLGAMRIDQVPVLNPETVKSYSDTNGLHFAQILHWKHGGFRTTLELHTHVGKIQCTPDHKIYTRRGWLEAQFVLDTDEILVCVDAGQSQLKGDFSRGGTKNVLHDSSCPTSTRSSTRSLRFAPADAEHKRGLCMGLLIHGPCFVGQNSGNTRTDTKTVPATNCLNSRRLRDRRFLARCSATHQFATRTNTLKRLAYQARMGLSRRNGPNTKQHSCIASVQSLASQTMQGGENSRSTLQRHAIRHSLRLTNLSSVVARKRCRESGSMGLVTSGLRGGCAMTGRPDRSRCFSIQRDSQNTKTNLSQNGFATTSERRQSSISNAKTPISFQSPVGHKSKLESESPSSSQSACDTSWCRVTKIVSASPTDVYDIEVEGSHCFFANKLLVHNCHSHVQKFRTFLDAHDAKRAELGLKPAFVLGLSATPQHKELNKLFSVIVKGPSPQWLIDNGYLSPFRYFQCTQGQLQKLVKSGDEYTSDSVADAMSGLAGDLVKDWKRLAEGRATIGFFPRRTHAQEAMELLRANGVDAYYVDGETPDDERRRLFKWLNEGEIDYICNVGVIERGTDIPRVGCVQMCTAVGSVVRWKQMIGRGSRVHPDVPDCLVLDHADGIRKHGFFEDDVEWTLEWGERPSKTHDALPTVNCPRCGAMYRGGKCRACGYEPTPKERKSQGLEFVGGELKEVKKAAKDTSAKMSNEALMVQALYIAGKRSLTFGQAWYIASNMAERQGTRFQVPATFVVAGKRYKTIPHGHPDSRRKVRDTYGFTQRQYGRDDNPYLIGAE